MIPIDVSVLIYMPPALLFPKYCSETGYWSCDAAVDLHWWWYWRSLVYLVSPSTAFARRWVCWAWSVWISKNAIVLVDEIGLQWWMRACLRWMPSDRGNKTHYRSVTMASGTTILNLCVAVVGWLCSPVWRLPSWWSVRIYDLGRLRASGYLLCFL